MASTGPEAIALQLGETIQTASINKKPSAAHDVNPSTAADQRVPLEKPQGSSSLSKDLRRKPRPQNALPLPDLRFEQSYLKSVEHCDTWQKVTWVTVRDMLVMPLLQGIFYNFAIFGWRQWNKSAQLSGNSVGARVRRWWYEVNNWRIPAMTEIDAQKKRL